MADSTFENLDVTPEEIQSLEKALKDEKFRKMLIEYAEELQDPENRRKYEEEIAMMEQNRGMDVTFINPSPGYVLKTNNGMKKVFINMCKSDKVAVPKAESSKQVENGVKKSGISWSMPYSLAPGREDIDKEGKTCMVYDVVFHPACFENASKDPRLKDLMEKSGLDGIEREFNEKLDRTNIKRPKMKFKGQVQATVIRKPNSAGPSGKPDSVSELNLPYPYDDKSSADSGKDNVSNAPAKSTSKISGTRNQTKAESKKEGGPTKPKYTVTHRGHFDIQQFTNSRDSAPSTRPQELIIRVELPLLKSAASVQLDVYERQIVLESKKPAAYKLDLPLPFPVDEEHGSAKFDKSKSCLIITVKVLPPTIPEMPSFSPLPETPALVEEIKQENGHQEQPAEHNGIQESDLPGQGDQKNETSKERNNNINICKDASQETEVNKLNNTNTAKVTDEMLDEVNLKPQKTICPKYTFKQDSETVTFIIQAPNIDPESIHKEVHFNAICTVNVHFRTKCEVVTTTASDESALKLYGLCVQFDDGCVVRGSEGLTVEVTDTGAVVVMKKEDKCRIDWTGFKAGASLDELKNKTFLTEENVLKAIDQSATTKDEAKSEPHMEVCVAEVSDQKLVVDFKRKEETSDCVTNKVEGLSESTLDPTTDVVIESLIGEASDLAVESSDRSPELLKLDFNRNTVTSPSDYTTSTATGSDTESPPSTPNSAGSLKSLIKRNPHLHRLHSSKSVSFSEDVAVEILVSPGKTKKGKRRPLVARHQVERLKDHSHKARRRYHSDSEVTYKPSGGGDFYMEDFGEDFKKVELAENRNSKKSRGRHSSSESDASGQDDRTAASTSKENGCKRRGGSKKQRRKQKAKRDLQFAEAQQGQVKNGKDESGDTPPISPDGSVASTKNGDHLMKDKSEVIPGSSVGGGVSSSKKGDSKVVTENTKLAEDDVPLEYQDHTTKCEVDFQNEVMFELDD